MLSLLEQTVSTQAGTLVATTQGTTATQNIPVPPGFRWRVVWAWVKPAVAGDGVGILAGSQNPAALFPIAPYKIARAGLDVALGSSPSDLIGSRGDYVQIVAKPSTSGNLNFGWGIGYIQIPEVPS
jgi:hypothetical protein